MSDKHKLTLDTQVSQARKVKALTAENARLTALLTEAAEFIARDGWSYFGEEGHTLALRLYDALGLPPRKNLIPKDTDHAR